MSLLDAFSATPPDSTLDVPLAGAFNVAAPGTAVPALATAFTGGSPVAEVNPPLAAAFSNTPPVAEVNIPLAAAWTITTPGQELTAN